MGHREASILKFHVNVMGRSKIWFSISGVIILIGILAIIFRGFSWGIDFTGGTIMEFNIGHSFDTKEITQILDKYKVGDYQIQKLGSKGDGVSIKTKVLPDNVRISIIKDIESKYNLTDKDLISSQQVGPSLGSEIKFGTFLAAGIAALLMLTYLGLRFNFEMSLAAVLALIHNVFILISVYAVFHITVDAPFIAAILTVFGYSVHDTIIIFDRIRDNLKIMRKSSYDEIANISVNQTMGRSINTVITVLIMLLLMYFLGPSALKDFALPLIIGITWGAYSSIFIASPLWVLIKNKEKGKKVINKPAKVQ